MVMKSDQLSGIGNSPRLVSGDASCGTRLRDELASISKLVGELETATSSLPYVREDGESECPFAENLYAKKEELEGQVSGKVNLLGGYLMELDAERLRCQKELDKIQEDYKKLNLQETSDHYAEAVLIQKEKCRSIEEDKDAVSVVLVKAKAVLKMAKERKFPGKKPQEQFPFPAGMTETPLPPSQSPDSRSQPGGLDNEIGGLISLGPQGGAEPREDVIQE